MRIHSQQKMCFLIPLLLLAIMLSAAAPISRLRAMGSNTPLFLPLMTYDSGGQSYSVAVADVNGDGKPDLLMANADGSVRVLLGNGDGTFQSTVSYKSGGAFADSVAVADVNGDGKPDLLVANCAEIGVNTCAQGDGVIGVLLGNGDGTFQPVATYRSGGIGAVSVVVADVNGDGKPDLLVANACGTSSTCQAGSVGALLGNGDGTFQAAVTYPSGMNEAFAVAVADVNGDGKQDLLVGGGGENDNVGVLLGNGDGTFQPVVSYSSGGNTALSVAVADVNGDGKPDLLAGNQCDTSSNCAHGLVGVLLGNGDGTFQPAVTYNAGGTGVWSVAVADVNGDGKPDLVMAIAFYNTVAILLGNGNGTFQAATTYGSGGILPRSVAVADLNGDGKPDVAVSNFCGSTINCLPGKVGVLLNNSSPLDTTPPVITLSATPKVLWPPNGKRVPVMISGTITDTGSGVNVNSAAYAVKDEYGEVQPRGAITFGPGGAYSFIVLLQASRLGTDLDGRRYTVTVRAKDNAGNGGSRTSVVTVPHESGRLNSHLSGQFSQRVKALFAGINQAFTRGECAVVDEISPISLTMGSSKGAEIRNGIAIDCNCLRAAFNHSASHAQSSDTGGLFCGT